MQGGHSVNSAGFDFGLERRSISSRPAHTMYRLCEGGLAVASESVQLEKR
jgi:hypothetical protein